MSKPPSAPIETDAFVIGAGPVGLFQVFELGLLDVGAQVMDALPGPGGQCLELYAEKPIYDIPGTPVCTAAELIERLGRQIAPFGAGFHFDEQVVALERRADDERFMVQGSRGTRLIAKAVVIASGAGAFQPRRLKIDGSARFEGEQLRYRVPDAAALAAASDIVVIGDEDQALETAIRLAETSHAGHVTLLHRRDQFRADAALVARSRHLRDEGRLHFVAGGATGFVERDGRLAALNVLTAGGDTMECPSDLLLVLTGLSPQLGPIAGWGLAFERRQIVVDPATFETSVPGVFAVGDAVAYRGKKRLIVCGFHEATLAAYAVAERVHPGRPYPLEYTTTSPRLQRLLGVAEPVGPAPPQSTA